MRIEDVRCVELTGTIDDPDDGWEERSTHPADAYPEHVQRRGGTWPAPTGGPRTLTQIFLEVEAQGLVGRVGPIDAEQARLVSRRLAPLLTGTDPLATERSWDLMYRAGAAHGRSGLEMTAISVMDCALWDLKGRHFGVPVWQLLGGPTRERIPLYVSTLGASLDPERAAITASHFARLGFVGQKWFPRFGPADGREGLKRNVELVEAVRAAVGPDVRLMIDPWMSWDARYALEFARLVAGCDLYWLEDPVMPERLDELAELDRRLGARPMLAAGERYYTRWQFPALIAAGVRVLQPEPFWSGGLSELVKIAALASAHAVALVPHGTSLGTIAHFGFAQPPSLVPMLEYLHRPQITGQWLLAEPVLPRDGHVDPPARPGLGMDLDESRIEGRRVLALD